MILSSYVYKECRIIITIKKHYSLTMRYFLIFFSKERHVGWSTYTTTKKDFVDSDIRHSVQEPYQ